MQPLVILAAAVAGLAALWLVVGWLEPRMAFYPSRGVDATPLAEGIAFQDFRIATSDGERLVVWRLPHPAPRGEILYFHGNGGNLSVWTPILAAVQRQGFTVVAPDYRGYGESSGRPSETGLYRDVDAVVEHFRRELHRPGVPVVYWGRSLGAVMAAYAATLHPPDVLVLEGGFPNTRALLSHHPVLQLLGLFSRYRFPTLAFVNAALPEGSSTRVLVLHGDADRVVPLEEGERLFDGIRTDLKTFFQVRGGDHNDVAPTDAQSYWAAIGRVLEEVVTNHHHEQGGRS